MSDQKEPLLQAAALSQGYSSKHGRIRALNSVSLELYPGETLGIAGESGSGKSTLLRLLSALEPPHEGEVRFEGQIISGAPVNERRAYYKKIGIVFQQPRLSFDPRWTLFRSLEEPLRINRHGSAGARERLVLETAQKTGLDGGLLQRYPAQLSGGQLQRAAIARAIILKPRLVFLDEPTAALDVSIQAQILNLLKDLQKLEGLAYVFVSHDISVLAYLSTRLMILKNGSVVETGAVEKILTQAGNAYTRTLLASVME